MREFLWQDAPRLLLGAIGFISLALDIGGLSGGMNWQTVALIALALYATWSIFLQVRRIFEAKPRLRVQVGVVRSFQPKSNVDRSVVVASVFNDPKIRDATATAHDVVPRLKYFDERGEPLFNGDIRGAWWVEDPNTLFERRILPEEQSQAKVSFGVAREAYLVPLLIKMDGAQMGEIVTTPVPGGHASRMTFVRVSIVRIEIELLGHRVNERWEVTIRDPGVGRQFELTAGPKRI
jgi:hypothetical protein